MKKQKVLFIIGNAYLRSNDMPDRLIQLSQALSAKVDLLIACPNTSSFNELVGLPFSEFISPPKDLEFLPTRDEIQNKIKNTASAIGINYYTNNPFLLDISKYNAKTFDFTNEEEVLFQTLLFIHQLENSIDVNSFDVIHVHDWISLIVGSFLKKQYNKKLILHAYSSNNNHEHKKIIELGKKHIHTVDRLIATNKVVKQQICNHFSFNENKALQIDSGIWLKLTYKQEKMFSEKLITLIGTSTDKESVHSTLEIIFNTFRQHPNVRFNIVNSDAALFKSTINSHNLLRCLKPIIKFTEIPIQKDLFPNKQINESFENILSTTDILCVLKINGFHEQFVFDAVQFGIPIIMPSGTEVTEILKGVLTFKKSDNRSVVNHLVTLLTDRKLKKDVTEQNYKDLNKITWKTITSKILKVYSEA